MENLQPLAPGTLYVVDCDGEQAIATSTDQAKIMIAEKFAEKLAAAFAPPKREECKQSEFRLYVNVEVKIHENGVTGWRKRR